MQHERDGSLARHRARQQEAAIRQQTEDEYEAALAADQKREREEEEAREAAELEEAMALSVRLAEEEAARLAAAKKAEEEAAAEAAEVARRERAKRAREELADEPPAGPNTTLLRIRLPNGTVLTRRFLKSATAADVFAWLRSCAELEPLGDEWSITLPALGTRPIEGGLQPTDESLQELDLCGATLFVQDESA